MGEYLETLKAVRSYDDKGQYPRALQLLEDKARRILNSEVRQQCLDGECEHTNIYAKDHCDFYMAEECNLCGERNRASEFAYDIEKTEYSPRLQQMFEHYAKQEHYYNTEVICNRCVKKYIKEPSFGTWGNLHSTS